MITNLKDICDFQSGGTPSKRKKEFFGGTIPWITTTALNGSQIDEKFAVEWITESAIVESAAKIVPEYSIMVGTRVGVGKVAINTVKMSTNQDIVSLLNIDECIWSKAYLCKLIKSKFAYLNSQSRGATIKGIKIDVLANLKITQIPLNRQRQVSGIIDRVQNIIEDRRKQLKCLDDLIRSRFVEMFGDPIINEKEWPCIILSDACQSILGGGTPSKSCNEFFSGTIPWVTPKDMKLSIINDSIDHITEDAIKYSTTNLVPKESVLMVIRSGILKHSLPVAMNSIPVTINQDMKAFIPGKNITAEFLLHFFKAIENDILSGVRSVTADNIDFKTFQKRMIIIPPLDLQQQFAAFIAQVDKSKVAVQKALDETQLLFDSLMQEYFG